MVRGSSNPLVEVLGESPGIVALRETIGRLLQRPSSARRLPPILIQGETGTGKGLLAWTIHRAGLRATGPFVSVNCAAIPETLLEAELFGFERGAFTDARQAKAGLFQAAHGGTLFLDEVGLLPEGLQSKLLKVIEDREVRRLGSTRSQPVDIWILTATSENLHTAMSQGRFYEALYHRLAVFVLWLPPLRERGRDILRLAEHFLARACADYGLEPKDLAPDAQAALLAYQWPGNVRELSNTLERAALLSEAPLVTAQMLGLPAAPREEQGETVLAQEAVPLAEAMGSVEREHLLEALNHTHWNISRAATRLGVSRNTLRYRIEKYGLRPGASAPPPRRQVKRSAAPALPTAAAPTVTTPSSIRWEQRHLTLLCAVLGVPPDTLSPSEAHRVLDILVEKVGSFGGRVEELSPTGAIAAFGVEPTEDAPSRAALAAIALQKATEYGRSGNAERLTVRLGLHAGAFMVGRVGDAVTIDLEAKRQAWGVLAELVQHAAPDTIVVTEAAAAFLTRRFELVPRETVGQLPEPTYRLVGRNPTGFGVGGRVTPLVGRQEELELLRNRLTAATRGQGQVVGIVGEPGIGKSRLLFEFAARLSGQPVTYLEGCCLSYGSAVPYLPLLDLVRQQCGLTDTDTSAGLAEKVRQSLQALGLLPDESAPYLLHLLGVKAGTEQLDVLSPEAIKARTFALLRQMSLHASRQQPLLVAIEDCHWSDQTSQEYLTSLVESLPGASILLLCTYRPGYRPPWLGKSYATQLALQPLTSQDSLGVVQAVCQTAQLPSPLAEVILRKAEGNPLFLEELTRAVAERGDVRPTVVVPDTLEEVLLARINRLPEGHRQLLQTAAVLGRDVSPGLLRVLWQGPGDLESQLQELQRLELLYAHPAPEEPLYRFKHVLTQEVAYASLLPPHRQALHAAAGQALEQLYAARLEEVYDRLAYHYAKTDHSAKAVAYLTRCAEKAARSYAHAEAITTLQEALVHAERLPVQERDRGVLELVLRQAFSLSVLGRSRDILPLLLAQRERLERLQDPALAGPYYFRLGMTYIYLGEYQQTTQHAQQALAEAQRCGDRATMGQAYYALALRDYALGPLLQGVEHGRQAVSLLDQTAEWHWLGLAHWVTGANAFLHGEFDSALEAVARVHAIGETSGDPRLESFAGWTTGWIHATRGDWEAAIAACQRALACSPDPFNTAVALNQLGYAYLEKGEPAEAIPPLERAAQQFGQFRVRQNQGRAVALLGEAALLQGHIEKARELASQALALAKGVEHWYSIGLAQRTLGRIAQAGGDLSEAEQHLQAALQTFTAAEARFEVARTHLALADLAHTQGNRDVCTRHLTAAYQLFQVLRVPKYVERAEQLARQCGVPLAAWTAAGTEQHSGG